MKKLIDANVILRYLLGDHPQMSEKAKKVIEAGAFTLPEVLAEVVYVLKGIYKVERAEIAKVLIDFLDEISIENQETIKKSVANGMGISILSRLATEDEVKEERILAIPIPYADDGRDINVVYNKNYQLPASAERFLKIVKVVYLNER